MQVVGLVGRFHSTPSESHLNAVKRIFKYLLGSIDFRQWYDRRKYLNIIVYIDVDWAHNIDDRRSTSGEALFLGNCLVSCARKKNNIISLSKGYDIV